MGFEKDGEHYFTLGNEDQLDHILVKRFNI